MKRWLIGLGAVGLLLGTRAANASLPAGVWVKVQKVVYEPDATAPTKIQIHGAAMLYDKSTGGAYEGYSDPALGFLYYECPKGQEKTCASEWADVEKNIQAPNDTCVGLGDQSLPTGTLRKPAAPPGTADGYPIAMGVLSGYTPCIAIESFLLGQPDGGSGGAAGSGSGGAAGNPASGGAAGSSTGGGAGSSSGGASSGGASSGGASSGGASTGGSSSGGGPSTGGSNSSSDSGDDGGCSVGGSSSSSTAWWSVAALGLALGLSRRRRG